MALATEHKVFLSHSGSQKSFVEQLNMDLKQCDRHAFFDKDRGCLPIGVKFPPLIFDAIQQCEVGVVVLSDEFLSTKWPMMELVEMAQRMARKGDRMILMPIFFGVTVEDLKVEENIRKWKGEWEKIAQNDIRIDILKWDQALKMLTSINGHVYNSKIGEVKFREEIVKEICCKVLPYLPWDDSHVQGKSQIIEIIESKKDLVGATHEIRVGLYGVGGIGKTTSCMVLCKHFEMEFYGKVCHVEVGKGTEKENLQMILKKFTRAQHDHLKELSIDQCRTRLKNIKERVFLAIDNLSSDSKVIDEVKTYLGGGYEHGSVLVVTARSLDQLKEVMDVSDCRPMPDIDEVGAKNLFCLHAEVKGEIENEILDMCINRCKFDKGKSDGSYHYLPLVLEVLGKHLRGSDQSTWVKKLQNVLNHRREKEHPVFGTFGISYDALRAEDKDLFLDVAVFHSTFVEEVMYYDYGLGSPLHWNVYEWLRLQHDLRDIGEVKHRLNILKTKSLLEEVDDYKLIGMHDLWKEFALYEIKAKEKESQRWVCEHDIEVEVGKSILYYGGWDNLERISILGGGEAGLEKDLSISACPKLKVLRLIDVHMPEGYVDLFELSNLRIMEIQGSCFQIVSDMGQLKNLRVLTWYNYNMDSMHILEHIGSLKYLTILQLKINLDEDFGEEPSCDEEPSAPPTTIPSLDLTKLRALQVAKIVGGGFTMLSLSLKLRVLDLSICYKFVNCPSLENMSCLEVLRIHYCPKLETLPNLQKLTNLRTLDISSNELLTEVSGLENMVSLQQFNAFGCRRLQTLPNMSKLTNLQKLHVDGCMMLECVPGLSNLISLSKLHVSPNSLRGTPHSGMLINLNKVYIGRVWRELINQESGTQEEEEDRSTAQEDCSTEEEGDMMEVDISLNVEASQAVDMLSNQEVGFGYEDNDIDSSRMDEGSNQEDGGHDFLLNKGVGACSSTESQQALDLGIFEHVLGVLNLDDIDCELKNVH